MIKKTYIPAKPRNKKLVNPAGTSLSMLRQEISGGYTDGIKQRVDAIEQKVNNTVVGSANLLRNTGFLGDFQSLAVDALTAVTGSTPISTNPLAHWVYSSTEVVDAPSRSGKGVKIGSIQQTVTLKQGSHVLSFWAKGNNLSVSLVETTSVAINDEYKRYSFDISVSQDGSYTFGLSGDASVYEIMLSEGNTDVSYSYSPMDDIKAISQLQAINVITSAIKEGDTQILGGLILTTMIQLGKYKDGVIEKVNAGISGIYNNDDDPAVWTGGTFEQAIRTVQKIKQDPSYNPTDEEWADMAKIVFTHGGDGFFRGYIYALGGMFRGKIETNLNGNKIIIDPSDRSLKMINSDGLLSLSMTFEQSDTSGYNDAKINVYTYREDKTVLTNSQISPGNIAVTSEREENGIYTFDETSIFLGGLQVLGWQTDGENYTEKYKFSINRNTITPGLQMEITSTGLPTTGDGLPPGMWYLDNGTLKIKQ